MHSSPCLLVALASALPFAYAASGSGKSTRYWDCCKPSCSWKGKAAVNRPVFACDANSSRISDPDVKSGCDGGSAFACADQSPWAVSNDLAYGFAATALTGGTEASWCCACYALKFTSGPVAGKTMVVQSTSTGADLGSNHFDLNIPGGGVGLFDGCRPQFGGLPGAQYGGISNQGQCSSFPAALKPGCNWRFEWFNNADNPNFTFQQVQCPAELVAKSGCKRADDGNFPVFTPPASNPNPTTPSQPSNPTSSPGNLGGCTVQQWAQCDGATYSGCKTCVAGTTCKFVNEYYSQCA